MSSPPSSPIRRLYRRTSSQRSPRSLRDEDNNVDFSIPIRRASTHHSLERRLTLSDRRRRSEGEEEGDENAFLSEVAAPPPLEWIQTGHGREAAPRDDTVEEGLRRASWSKDRDGEGFLTELAAPRPIEERAIEESESSEDYEPPELVSDHRRRTPSDAEKQEEREEGDEEERGRRGRRREEKPSRRRRSYFATELYTVSYLIFFAIWGTLARMGLQRLTFYSGAPITFSLIWPNFGGSVFIGFLAEDRNIFRDEWGSPREDPGPNAHPDTVAAYRKTHGSVKKTIPLYIGLATGFCGSFTSFSGFVRDCFLAMSNDLNAPFYHPRYSPISDQSHLSRSGGYSFLALLAVLITTLCLSLIAVSLGAHIALFLSPITPTLPFRLMRRYLDPLMVFLSLGCWLGAVFLAIWPPDRFSSHAEHWRGQAIFPVVFGPLGCLGRFYLSKHLNGLLPSFPLGTFTSNVAGTMIEGMVFDFQHSDVVSGAGSGQADPPYHDLISCQVLQGINDGFCGCLTTVSTWVAELRGLRWKHAYWYGAVSWAVAFTSLVVEIGAFRWTHEIKEAVCKTAN